MNKLKLFLLDLFFPNRCPICGRIILYDEYLCSECVEKVMKSNADDNAVYGVCEKHGFVCWYYEETAKNGILSLKENSKNFGYFIAAELSKKILSDNRMKNADLITAVPMSKERLAQRGYNQAAVIAKELSYITGIPFDGKLLLKNKSAVQHTLGREERRLNINAFYSSGANLDGKKIIICDDVITTGSTINKCTELLTDMKAAEVYPAAGTIVKYC